MAQGKGSAVVVWAAAFLLVSAAVVALAADHSVGGATNGWSKPNGNTLSATYLQDWATAQSFSEGDRLRKYIRGLRRSLSYSLFSVEKIYMYACSERSGLRASFSCCLLALPSISLSLSLFLAF